jgi:hypothetical protein
LNTVGERRAVGLPRASIGNTRVSAPHVVAA